MTPLLLAVLSLALAQPENGNRFASPDTGWETVSAGKRGDPGEVPMIVRGGTDNGAWFHSGHLWVQNEDTAKLKDLVDRRSFADLLKKP